MSEDGRGWLRPALNATMVAACVLVLVLLVAELGFPLAAVERWRVVLVTKVVLWIVAGMEVMRLALHEQPLRYLRRHPFETALAILMLLLLALKPTLLPRLHGTAATMPVARVEMLYLGVVQVVVLILIGHRLLYFNRLLAFARVSPRLILIGSFVSLIVIGSGLLMLPRATSTPGSLPWIDALFTSTSAVCVTGLIVVDTATVFTGFGQTVILILIQLGGLGLMTFAYFFVALFGGGITLRDRALLLEILNEEHVGRVTGNLIAIVLMTLAFEAVGAVLLHQAILASSESADWFASVFHSVSAFCNAGFSTYTLGLFDPVVRANAGYQVVIMGLIVVGGLGFPVLKNLWDHLRGRLRHPRQRAQRLSTHTKIVLTTTALLVIVGAAMVGLFEYGLADQPRFASPTLTALFTSVTARTAGFNTVPVELFTPATAITLILLMFIGGSPASTAGGIKTATFAIAVLNTGRILRNSTTSLVAFGRQIPANLANRAFAVVLLAMGWVGLTTLTLVVLMPDHAPLDLAFEAVSAFGTVGLSRGITASLPAAGKLVLVLSMIVGRIGILYVALGVLRKERPGRIGYPEENVIIS